MPHARWERRSRGSAVSSWQSSLCTPAPRPLRQASALSASQRPGSLTWVMPTFALGTGESLPFVSAASQQSRCCLGPFPLPTLPLDPGEAGTQTDTHTPHALFTQQVQGLPASYPGVPYPTGSPTMLPPDSQVRDCVSPSVGGDGDRGIGKGKAFGVCVAVSHSCSHV